jgi:hypothetical protein
MLRRSTGYSCDAVGCHKESTENAQLEAAIAATHDYKPLQLARVTALAILPVKSRYDNRAIQKPGRRVIYELQAKLPMFPILSIFTLECTYMHEG